jgi:hypothetical protein
MQNQKRAADTTVTIAAAARTMATMMPVERVLVAGADEGFAAGEDVIDWGEVVLLGVEVGDTGDAFEGFGDPGYQPGGVTNVPVIGLVKLRVMVWGATLSQ